MSEVVEQQIFKGAVDLKIFILYLSFYRTHNLSVERNKLVSTG